MSNKKLSLEVVTGIISITCILGLFLSSNIVLADDSVIDEINITVPVSCSMSGVGMNTHNATINNGSYNSAIGETTINAVCNDTEGFAIYAIGYTEDTDGKNVLTNQSLGSTHDIVTGTAISGDTSNWAMKLTKVTTPTPTYPIIIAGSTDDTERQSGDLDYSSFQPVPSDYTLVAKRASGTDVGVSAEGSNLKTTYQAYINKTQPAGTYSGQVKYVLVHPSYVDESAMRDAVTVIYDGNGLNFSDGSTTNTVRYGNVCKSMGSGYVANTPYTTVQTSNLNDDGTRNQNNSYSNEEYILQTITMPNADIVKVVVDYGITSNSTELIAFGGTWDGDWDNWQDEWSRNSWIYGDDDITGTYSYYIYGNTVTIFADSWESPTSGYDYGFYVRVYPVYNTEQANTASEEIPPFCSIATISGDYQETTTWKDSWYIMENEIKVSFWNQYDVHQYVVDNYDLLKGTIITIYADNPIRFQDVYADANKTKINSYYVMQDLNYSMCSEVDIGLEETVMDIRDNSVYTIAKLADGNCWLIDNLRLDPRDSATAANLSASNTNATSEAIYNYLHGGNSNNIPGWSSSQVSYPSDNYTTPEVISSYSFMATDKAGHGSSRVGVYYNFCAATVGTYCYSSDIGVDIENTIIDAPYDLCPANWRMPTGGNEGELKTLYTTYDNDDTSAARAFSVTLAGYKTSATTVNYGISGYYWSSTYYSLNNSKMYALRSLHNNADYWSFSKTDYESRNTLLSMRCLVAH